MGASLPGTRNPNARFTAAQVREIRALWRRGRLSAEEIAARYRCHKSAIYRMVRGESYTAPRYSPKPTRERFTKKGERHPQSKLSVIQVVEIKRMLKRGDMTKTAIGARFGVSRSHIGAIASGKYWRHIKP